MLLCLGISRAPTANTTSTRTQATSGSSRCKIHKSRNTSTHLPLQRAVLLELERAAHLGGFFAAFRVAVSKISITNRSHHQSKKKKNSEFLHSIATTAFTTHQKYPGFTFAISAGVPQVAAALGQCSAAPAPPLGSPRVLPKSHGATKRGCTEHRIFTADGPSEGGILFHLDNSQAHVKNVLLYNNSRVNKLHRYIAGDEGSR